MEILLLNPASLFDFFFFEDGVACATPRSSITLKLGLLCMLGLGGRHILPILRNGSDVLCPG